MVIGFTGYKGTGKSTAAKYLEDKYGFVRHNFKDALVDELKDNFPDLLREIWKQDTKEWKNGITPCDSDYLFRDKPPIIRALMQNYGTEVRRKDDPDYWVRQWIMKLPKLESSIRGIKKIVTDDVRFINECKAIKTSSLGFVIRIERTDITSGGDHTSETEQLQITPDHTITCEPNDHNALYRKLDSILFDLGFVTIEPHETHTTKTKD